MDRLHQWIGNVFFRGASPAEINVMTYHELKYWNDWHELMTEAEKRSVDDAKSKKKGKVR